MNRLLSFNICCSISRGSNSNNGTIFIQKIIDISTVTIERID